MSKNLLQYSSNSRPLAGIRVLDFTTLMAGPFCTRLLADMGAEVLKIEPVGGEHSRFRPPFLDGKSVHFAHLNCGKKSLVLDLKSKPGREAARALASHSDIVVENWRPGVVKRLGLDYEELRKGNEKLIYCSISGYGQSGPSSREPAYASIVEAVSGYAYSQMDINKMDSPPVSGTFLGDSITGLWAFSAIQTALFHRSQTGKGQFVDVTMLESMMHMLINEFHIAQIGPFIRRFHLPLKTKDGHVVVPPVSGANWEALAKATGHPEWITDQRFSTIDARNNNWFEMLRLTEIWTSEKTSSECLRVLHAAGVPVAVFNTVKEALQLSQLKARGSLTPIKFKEGDYCVANVPFLASAMNVSANDYVSDLNSDCEEILASILGYSSEQIAACKTYSLSNDPH